MKKTLLLLALLVSLGLSAARYELPISDLGSSGWGDCTNENGTVTYPTAWTGIGWWLAPENTSIDFSAYNKVVVNFEALPFDVKIVVEYTGSASSETMVSAGATTGSVELNPEYSASMMQVYLQGTAAGTIKVLEAYATDDSGGPAVTRENLSLADLGSGWSSSYDAGTKTITFDDSWVGRGWWLGSKDLSAFDKVVVVYEPAEMQVKLVVQYSDDSNNDPEVYAPAGSTTMTVMLDPEKKSDVKQIYIQNESPGTLTLVEAYLEGEADEPVSSNLVFDFEENTIGDTYPRFKWWGEEVGAFDVEEDPLDATNKVLKFVTGGYNDLVRLGTVTLPEGATWGDVTSVSFDLYNGAEQYKNTYVMVDDEYVEIGGYPQITKEGAWMTTTLSKETIGLTAHDSKNSFAFYVGVNDDGGVFYLDNVTIALASGNFIEIPVLNRSKVFAMNGGIVVDNNNQTVAVYGIDGRLIQNTTASTIFLQKGMYIVKVGQEPAVKIIVR